MTATLRPKTTEGNRVKSPANSPRILWLALAARMALGAIFIFSGFDKAAAPPQEFAAVIDAYYLLPPDWTYTAAVALPWLELILGVFLLAGYWTRLSAAALGVMLCAFIFALITTITRGISLPSCGCFGSFVHLKPPQAVALDCLLLAILYVSYKYGRGQWSLDNWVEAGS